MSKPPVILRNATAEAAELWFYTEFGPDYYGYISADLVRSALGELQVAGTKKLTLHVNCDGGDIFEALAIYNLLKNSGMKVTAMIDGLAASCASWVVQAATTIRIAENGLMMIHNPMASLFGDAEDLRRTANVLDTTKSQIVGMYASRSTKQTAEQFAAAMDAETWYTAAQALDAGLVDEIDPNKSTVVNVANWQNAPEWVKSVASSGQSAWRNVMNRRKLLLQELEAAAV